MVQFTWIKPIVGWVGRNIIPVGIVLGLLFTHWWAYDNGKETIEQKYEKQRNALLDENARLQERNQVLNANLATKQVTAKNNRAEEKTQALVEANDYVRNHPHDPSCYVTESDLGFLRQSPDKGPSD